VLGALTSETNGLALPSLALGEAGLAPAFLIVRTRAACQTWVAACVATAVQERRESVLVSAHTSAGKTAVAE
jgi:hypothetical protein